MKSNLLLCIVLLTTCFGIISCDKDDESKPECELNQTGTIAISNNSSNPYDIYIDDQFEMRLSGNNISQKIRILEGNGRKLYAEQVSGYVLYPTERTNYFNVVRCSDYSWQIP